MKKNTIIRTVAIVLVGFTLTVAALETKDKLTLASNDDAKSVAWYTANVPVAKAKNQECHDSPSIATSADCVNALYALEISFGVTHKP